MSKFNEMLSLCGDDMHLFVQVFFDIAFERRLLDPNNLDGVPVKVEVSKYNPTQEVRISFWR